MRPCKFPYTRSWIGRPLPLESDRRTTQLGSQSQEWNIILSTVWSICQIRHLSKTLFLTHIVFKKCSHPRLIRRGREGRHQSAAEYIPTILLSLHTKILANVDLVTYVSLLRSLTSDPSSCVYTLESPIVSSALISWRKFVNPPLVREHLSRPVGWETLHSVYIASNIGGCINEQWFISLRDYCRWTRTIFQAGQITIIELQRNSI